MRAARKHTYGLHAQRPAADRATPNAPGVPNHPDAPAKYSHWTVRAAGKVDRRFADINQVKARLPEIFEGDQIVPGELPVPQHHPIPIYVDRPPSTPNHLQDPIRMLRELQAEAQEFERLTIQMREYAASLSVRITKVLHQLEDA